MRIVIYAASLAIGLVLGTLIFRNVPGVGATPSESEGMRESFGKTSIRSGASSAVRADRMILRTSRALNHQVPLDEATMLLLEERKSPMRTRAFLKKRVHLMNLFELNEAFMNGEIQGAAEIREAARRIMSEDPDLGFKNFREGYQFDSLQNRFEFSDAMLQLVTDDNESALAMMRRLQAMDRGGRRNYLSMWLSRYWAQKDPAVAVTHFDELIRIKGILYGRDYLYEEYSADLVRSWMPKDEEGMRAYVSALPSGRKRDALSKAIRNADAAREAEVSSGPQE